MRRSMKTRHSLSSFAAALLLMVLFSSSASAVIVRAVSSCGQWVQERQANGRPEDANRFWSLGYMSGRAVDSGMDLLKNTDAASIELWMDNYCKAHPLKSVADGGDVLFAELVKKTWGGGKPP